MKKTLSLILAAALAVSLTACGGTGNSSTPSGSPEDSTVTEEELTTIFSNIADAEESADELASLLLDEWTTYASVMEHYYDKEKFESGNLSHDKTIKKVHELRDKATETLSDAKQSLGTKSTGDFYDAVKTYYLAVNNYLALLSEFPDGYSQLTYSNAISDCRSTCQSAHSEASFFIE